MSGKEEILRALEAKGYPRATITVEWEPVSYYGTGREGGWIVRLDDEELELASTWGEEVIACTPGSKDVFDIGFGSIMAYSLSVVLNVIKQLDRFANLVAYYRRHNDLVEVTEFSQLFDGDTLLVVSEQGAPDMYLYKGITLKRSRSDGEEVILEKKTNRFFNFGMYLSGESWVKECYLVK